MLEYEISENGEKIGTCQAERDGLYWEVTARLFSLSQKIRKLYARKGVESVCLGTFLPDGEGSGLQKRISDRQFSFTEDCILQLEEQKDFLPWQPRQEKICGYLAPECEQRKGKQGMEYRFPAKEGQPFPILPLFCFFRYVQEEDGAYWYLDTDEAGEPVMG